MIEARYVQTMARYNSWQNKQIRGIVNGMDEVEIVRDRGAFFGSILGTLNHLLWADTIWMSRWCDDVSAPEQGIAQSIDFTPTPGAWDAARFRMDGRIQIWAETLNNIDLKGDLSWFSGALGRQVTRPLALCVAHMFNHQTHHRGQIHTMLSQAGQTPPVTDLFAMPEQE